MFVVFALGDLYSERASRTKNGRGVPGTAFFLRAMALLQDLHEEPTIPYIETLLLIVSV
jgi:proline utilization trans-activator